MSVIENSKVNPPGQIVRNDLIQLLDRALSSGNFRFIQSVSRKWLEKYPNDIDFQCFLLRSSLHSEDQEKLTEIVNSICNRDVENTWAWGLKQKLDSKKSLEDQKFNNSILFILGKDAVVENIYEWARIVKKYEQEFNKDALSTTVEKIQNTFTENNETPLIGIYHLRYAKKIFDKEIFNRLANQYHEKCSDCIAISLWLADSFMELGKEIEAVSLLHSCAVMDPGGEVIKRLWGKSNEYLSMWPSNMSIQLAIPIPQQLAVPMNWRQLPSGNEQKQEQKNPEKNLINKIDPFHKKTEGEKSSTQGKSEINSNSFDDFQEKDLNDLIKKSGTYFEKKENGKKPVYVILTIKKDLVKKYGGKSSQVISTEIKKLADAFKANPGWDSIIFYPDEENCMRLYDLDPLVEIDPWKVKLALVDLDKYFNTKGQMIGCVLIVGGGDIVPFHSLPNPTDDKDKEVFSDNPYTTLDANYFVPEWPVGRLPGEKSNDPGLLLKQIRQICASSQNKFSSDVWWQILFNWLLNQSNPMDLFKTFFKKPANYGYTASVWRRSSLASFRPIGNGNFLRVTPPFESSTLDIDLLNKAKIAYFNLHGMPDTPEWYGQRDMSENSQGPDFPIAITAKQISTADSAPSLVFSEACYGAYIDNKNSDESIALKFKDAGTAVFIGSTCISYGSINTPLIGADLLAFIFWKYLLDGLASGEAFMRAKLSFAQVMMQRQGYLDGEDQKILLSFVYYGDPLYRLTTNNVSVKAISRRSGSVKINAISDQDGVETAENRVSGEILTKIKNDLKEYLPAIDSAEIKIHPHQFGNNIFSNEFGQNHASVHSMPGHTKITYYRPVTFQRTTHFQYARVTIDRSGKMVKLVMSR